MSRLYTRPIAQVVILDMDTKETWSLGSPDFPFLSSVNLYYEGKMVITSMEVGLDIPYEYAIRMMQDGDNSTMSTNTKRRGSPFKHGNYIRARLGYEDGAFTEWAYGLFMEGGHGLTISSEGLTGTIKASTISYKAAGYTVSADWLESAGYDASVLLRNIAEALGLSIEITDGALENMKAWSSCKPEDASYKTKTDFMAGLKDKETWSVVGMVCKQLDCDFHIGVKSNKRHLMVYTGKEVLEGKLSYSKSSINKYVMRGILDPSQNQYPCYSISPTSGDDKSWTMNATAAAHGVKAVGHNTETGEDVREEITTEQSDDPGVGHVDNTTPVDFKYTTAEWGEIVANVKKQYESMGTFMSAPIIPGGSDIFRLQAKHFGESGNPGLQIKLSTIGMPDEQIGNLCQVWGCGDLYNGPYRVQGITHSWTPGNWDTELDLYRKGRKLMAGEKKSFRGGQMR